MMADDPTDQTRWLVLQVEDAILGCSKRDLEPGSKQTVTRRC
jgi:hypothetical protein